MIIAHIIAVKIKITSPQKKTNTIIRSLQKEKSKHGKRFISIESRETVTYETDFEFTNSDINFAISCKYLHSCQRACHSQWLVWALMRVTVCCVSHNDDDDEGATDLSSLGRWARISFFYSLARYHREWHFMFIFAYSFKSSLYSVNRRDGEIETKQPSIDLLSSVNPNTFCLFFFIGLPLAFSILQSLQTSHLVTIFATPSRHIHLLHNLNK